MIHGVSMQLHSHIRSLSLSRARSLSPSHSVAFRFLLSVSRILVYSSFFNVFPLNFISALVYMCAVKNLWYCVYNIHNFIRLLSPHLSTKKTHTCERLSSRSVTNEKARAQTQSDRQRHHINKCKSNNDLDKDFIAIQKLYTQRVWERERVIVTHFHSNDSVAFAYS